LAVVGKSPAEVATRADYFQKMIDLQLGSKVLKDLGVVYHPRVPELLAHVYFALSEAYKAEFLYPGKRTDPTKIAAITCATIAVVRPLHAPVSTITKEEYIYMNEILAMRCACSIVDHPVHIRGFDEQRRVYKMLQRLQLPSVDQIINEAVQSNGAIASEVQIKLLPQEEFALKALINLFVVYKDLKIFKEAPKSD